MLVFLPHSYLRDLPQFLEKKSHLLDTADVACKHAQANCKQS